MKNTTCAWYFRGENTISLDCRMLLQTCKTAGEGKQMSCFKWWRMNWQTPVAEDRTNLKIWNFFLLSFFFPFFPFSGGGASILQAGEILSRGVTCVCTWLLHLFMDSFLFPLLRLAINWCDTEMLSSSAGCVS